MSRAAIALILSLGLAACSRSPYQGYKRVGDEVHLQLLVLGDGESTPADSDLVLLRIRAGRPGQAMGELFSTEGTYLTSELRSGAFRPILGRIHEGDSMSVIAPATQWPWVVMANERGTAFPDTGMVQVEVSLLALRTPAMLRAEKERFRRNDPLGYEARLMQAYREQAAGSLERWGTSELFFEVRGTASDTNKVVLGDQVTISYTGLRVEDGAVFDDTGRNGEPFSFRFGDKDQVMEGLEIAVHLLREGQQGTFLIPSAFAFGAKGIPGVLDPHMPVLYNVRLEKVERVSTRAKPVQKAL
ncbi:MAG: FKBP-type peptidyl-prolyl cis-trans isomerase [Flavobacteriales bacterium]